VKPLIGDDIADVCFYVASAPKHVQIAEVTILATHQASPFLIARNATPNGHEKTAHGWTA